MRILKRDIGRACKVNWTDVKEPEKGIVVGIVDHGLGIQEARIFFTDRLRIDVVEFNQIIRLGKRVNLNSCFE